MPREDVTSTVLGRLIDIKAESLRLGRKGERSCEDYPQIICCRIHNYYLLIRLLRARIDRSRDMGTLARY